MSGGEPTQNFGEFYQLSAREVGDPTRIADACNLLAQRALDRIQYEQALRKAPVWVADFRVWFDPKTEQVHSVSTLCDDPPPTLLFVDSGLKARRFVDVLNEQSVIPAKAVAQ